MAKVFQVDTGGTLTTGLLAYYKLEDANDFYSTNNLTNNGSATFASGKVNNAVDLESGSSQYLSLGTNIGVDGGNFSWAGWINLESSPADGQGFQVFEQFSDTTSNVGYFINYINQSGTFRLQFERIKRGTADDNILHTTTLSTGTWYFVALTYNGSTVTAYFNSATAVGTTSSSGNGATDDTTAFNIGASRSGGANFDGKIDEVGVWSKALSGTEITDLFNGGNGQTMTNVTFSPKVIIF